MLLLQLVSNWPVCQKVLTHPASSALFAKHDSVSWPLRPLLSLLLTFHAFVVKNYAADEDGVDFIVTNVINESHHHTHLCSSPVLRMYSVCRDKTISLDSDWDNERLECTIRRSSMFTL